MSVNRVADVHGVATTINLIIMIDTQSGRVKHSTKPGPISYLDQLLWLPGSTGWVTVIVHLLWMWMFRVVWRRCQYYMGVEKNGFNVVVTDDGSMRSALHLLKWAQMEGKDFVHTVCCSFIIHYGANFVLIIFINFSVRVFIFLNCFIYIQTRIWTVRLTVLAQLYISNT